MTINNSTLIDDELLLFDVLELVRIKLFDGVVWQGEDINEVSAKGAVFYAYDEPPTESIASITIVDVTEDLEEPDILKLSADVVSDVDAKLNLAVRSNMDLIQWMGSHLNQTEKMKALVTAYVVKNNSKDWQYIASRFSVGNRKIAAVGMFDVSKQDPLAKLVFQSLRSVSFMTS
jgi:hypothetical protein